MSEFTDDTCCCVCGARTGTYFWHYGGTATLEEAGCTDWEGDGPYCGGCYAGAFPTPTQPLDDDA